MHISLKEQLEKEKEKLNGLIEQALKRGVPIGQDEAVMEQNRHVDALVIQTQKESRKNRRKDRS